MKYSLALWNLNTLYNLQIWSVQIVQWHFEFSVQMWKALLPNGDPNSSAYEPFFKCYLWWLLQAEFWQTLSPPPHISHQHTSSHIGYGCTWYSLLREHTTPDFLCDALICALITEWHWCGAGYASYNCTETLVSNVRIIRRLCRPLPCTSISTPSLFIYHQK